MSVTVNYRRLSPEEFRHYQADDAAAATYFGRDLEEDDDEGWDAYLAAERADARYLDIQKAWHGMDFLISGKADNYAPDPENPLQPLVFGGAETEWERSYGVVQYLTVDEVKGLATALEAVDEGELRGRFDAAAFGANKIYPNAGAWGPADLDWILGEFGRVRRFMEQSARDGEMVLISFE